MQSLDFKPAGVIVLHVRHGDVVVRGQPERSSGQLIARPAGAPDQMPQITQVEGETHLYTSGDVTLTLPSGSRCRLLGDASDVVLRTLGEVSLEHCHGDLVGSDLAALEATGDIHGDAALRQIAGGLSLERVHGDLAAANAGSVRVAAVEGDASLSVVREFNAGRIHGDLHVVDCHVAKVREIDGDASFASIADAVEVKRLSGDLTVTAPGRTLAAPDVSGNARLIGALAPGGTYWIGARGDVVARVSGNVRIAARARGDVKLSQSAKIEARENGLVRATLGDPERAASLNIESQGNVKVNAPGKADRASASTVDAEVRRALAEAQKEVARAAGAIGSDLGKDIGRTAGQVGAQVSAQVGAEVGASMRSMVRDLFDSLNTKSPPAPPPPSPAAGPSGDELRAVLDMLAAGAISASEAESLIDALKG